MSLLQLASIVLLGRFLGYKELGIYTIFQIIFRLAITLFEPGMFVSIIQKTGFTLNILKKAKRIQGILVVTGVIILMLFFGIEKEYLSNNSPIVILSILLFVLIGFFSQYTALLTRQLRQKEISISQMIGSSIEFVFILSTIWFISPLLVFSCALLLRFMVYYILCWWYLRNTTIEEDTSVSEKDHLHFSTYQVVNQGLSFVQGNFDTVLVGSVFGLSVLGPYNFASEISYLLFSKINPVFNKAIFPVLSKFQNQAKERQNIISESLLSHALICISLYLLMYFNIESLIPLAAKDPEGLILGFAKFILIMAMIRSVNNMVFNQLLSLGESRNLLKWNIVVLIINYTFITIIYFSGASIQKFLFINIFLSLAVLIYILNRLKRFYSDHQTFYKQIITYLIYFISCGALLYAIHLLELHFILSLILGIMAILILSLGFYKQKLLSLIRFRIM